MSGTKPNRREQVKGMIEQGEFTKAQIAEELSVSAASVSSQMTYLRWMGNFIKYDADKILTIVTEEEHVAWQEELAANRKSTSVSNKTPEEQAEAVFKTIERQNSSLTTWTKKAEKVEVDLIDEPDDEELLELKAEADANVVLLGIKIKRNERKAADLPDYVPVEETADADADADVEGEEDDLL